GLGAMVTLTQNWRKYNLLFTAGSTVPGHNRIAFVLGDAAGQVDLADVQLASLELGSSLPSSEAFPLVGTWVTAASAVAPQVVFRFHSDGTGTVGPFKPGSQGATLSDRSVDAFRWNVAPGDHRVVIGNKTYRWLLASGDQSKLILRTADGKTTTLYKR
ncbi:MAG TPA: hypothetical protein VGS41_13770, partial [Chthonomonadales bacterium]|nr:hypothetical protein [Chthonomonadales bacterium]